MSAFGSIPLNTEYNNGVSFSGGGILTDYHKFIYDAMPYGWIIRHASQTSSFRTHSQSKGGARRFTSGATSGNAAGMIRTILGYGSDGNPWFECRIATVESTSVTYYAGLRDSGTAYSSASDKYMMFRSTSGGVWTAICANGAGSESTTTLTDSPVVGTLVTLSIKMTSTTSATFYINGVSRGTLSSNLPSVSLSPCIEVITSAAATKSVDICYISTWQDE